MGAAFEIAKSSSVSIKLKKGINYFALTGLTQNTLSDSVTVKINGQSVTSLGLKDEKGALRSDTYSTNTSASFYQAVEYFIGLNGEENIIDIENTDSASKPLRIDSIIVGFQSEEFTINGTVNIKAGRAIVRGTEVSFSEADLEVSGQEGNGHTASIVADDAGLITILNGEQPVMSQVKPEEAISFSGAVTSLPMKSVLDFPTTGIFLMSTPYGNFHYGSYTSITDATVQTNSLDDILWQSKPTKDFTPLNGLESASLGGATGDLMINYFGSAPIIITSTESRLDFALTINGVRNVYSATIVQGGYSADIVPIERAIRDGMEAAFSAFKGEYRIKYNSIDQLWNIYIESDEVENLELLFGDGINFANSIHPTLGYPDTNTIGSLSYVASAERQHLCSRVWEKEKRYVSQGDPMNKYRLANVAPQLMAQAVQDKLGFGDVRYMTNDPFFQLFPDSDCIGLELDFIGSLDASMIGVQIDDGLIMYPLQTSNRIAPTTAPRGQVLSTIITWPRGSRKITVRGLTNTQFNINGGSSALYFLGHTQLFSRPAYEKLTLSQSILETIDVSPRSMYATTYGHNAGVLYSPAGSNDNLNTLDESGSWASSGATQFFNGGVRLTTTTNDSIEADFTIVKDGGKIGMKTQLAGGYAKKVALFISASAIVEGTDRIQNVNLENGVLHYDQNAIMSPPLKAGTYKARFKKEGTGNLNNSAIMIEDGVAPQENANTNTDIANTGQGIAYPVNVIRDPISKDSSDRIPVHLDRSGYKEGKTTKMSYGLNSPAFTNFTDSESLRTQADNYYGNNMLDSTLDIILSITGFFKSVCSLDVAFTSSTANVRPFVDGVQTLNSYSQATQVKGGSATSSVRVSATRMAQKIFDLSCSFASGDTFNVSDTRGIRVGEWVLLDDGTDEEKALVVSIISDTSFTVKYARAVVTDGSVVSVKFYGLHTFAIQEKNGSNFQVSAFEYEPLKLSPSKALQRSLTTVEYERLNVDFSGTPTFAYYPVHSDGVSGSYRTSTVQVYIGDAISISKDLKTISGVTEMSISSEKLVPIINEDERF